jgi:predicted protein tyrosine phosphatase
MDLGSLNKHKVSHIVSIWHPDEATEEYIEMIRETFDHSKVHATVFDDVEREQPPYHCATPEQVRAVLNFGAGVKPADHLVVHCMAGISRSTACAISILAHHLGPGSEREIASHIRKIRPQAWPNRLVLTHADKLLNRKGALLAAYDEVFGDLVGEVEINKGW